MAPAGSPTLLADLDAGMIEIYYKKTIEDLVPNFSKTIKKIEQGTAGEMNNRGVSLVLSPFQNESETWSAAEYADFPDPGNAPLVKATIPFTGVRCTALFSDQVIESSNSPSALTNHVTSQIAGKMRALGTSRNFFMWGDASGEMARVSAYNSTTFVTTCNNSGNLYGSQIIRKGMQLEWRTSGGVLVQGGGVTYGTVTAVSKANKTFTTDTGPTDVASTNRVYRRGSYGNGPRAFLYHVAASGAWQGLADRTIYDETYCITIDAAGDPVSAGLMQALVSARNFQLLDEGDSSKSELYASSQRDGYRNACYDLKVLQNTTKGELGIDEVDFNGRRINYEPHVQRDFMWDLDVMGLKEFRMTKEGIRMVPNSSGGAFHRMNASSGQGHGEGQYVYWSGRYNYATDNPSKLGAYISGLSTSGLELGNR